MLKHQVVLCVLASSLGLALAPAGVDAAQKNVSGTVCNPWNAGEANDIDYVASGVRTLVASARNVICAIPRDAVIPGASPFLNVFGDNFSAVTTTISGYSYDSLGNFKGSQTYTTAAVGAYKGALHFTAAQVPADATMSLLVTLPASAQGTFRGALSDQ